MPNILAVTPAKSDIHEQKQPRRDSRQSAGAIGVGLFPTSLFQSPSVPLSYTSLEPLIPILAGISSLATVSLSREGAQVLAEKGELLDAFLSPR